MITAQLDTDIKEAMKAKNESALSTLRMAKSALKNKQIDTGKELTDDEAQAVLRTMVKQYKDALADFTNAGRTDLATKQAGEIELLERYLPSAMPEGELEQLTKEVIAETGATSAKDMGKVMGAVIKKAAGRADGNSVRAIVQKLLP